MRPSRLLPTHLESPGTPRRIYHDGYQTSIMESKLHPAGALRDAEQLPRMSPAFKAMPSARRVPLAMTSDSPCFQVRLPMAMVSGRGLGEGPPEGIDRRDAARYIFALIPRPGRAIRVDCLGTGRVPVPERLRGRDGGESPVHTDSPLRHGRLK